MKNYQLIPLNRRVLYPLDTYARAMAWYGAKGVAILMRKQGLSLSLALRALYASKAVL